MVRRQFVLPEAVDDRLERLLDLGRERGERVSRSDIVAALVWHSPLDGEGLGVTVRRYRAAMLRQPSQRSAAQRPPGPRPFNPLSEQ